MKKNLPSPPLSGAPSSLTRRQFLNNSAGMAASMAFGSQFLGLLTAKADAPSGPLPQKNILLIITDQERATQWFPTDWEEANLPTLTRLKNNGITFNKAFCSAACCTPSRNSFFTGLFPAQHGSMDTLSDIDPQNKTECQLDPTLPNLATCMKEAGYDVIYKGKWHMSTPTIGADGSTISDDISRYGFDGWGAPDAGTTLESRGGGTPNHDQRFLDDAIAFLQNRLENPTAKPFCLIVSLVNPHDVILYPGAFEQFGYTDDPWLNDHTPDIDFPPTINEPLDLNGKPSAQRQFLTEAAQVLAPLPTPAHRKNYINFYAHLIKEVDRQIGDLLSVFDNGGEAGQQLLNDTLIIRTSDHGEMGLSHGALRQKCFVAYEETIRVPLVWSNPQLFPQARTTDHLVSHVDFLPTLCSLSGVPNWKAKGFKGVDYSSILLDPEAPPVQDYVLFTYNDIFAGQSRVTFQDGIAHPVNCIQMIRTADFKYARYYDPTGMSPDEEEFYDLRPEGGDYDADYQQPLEQKNLSEWTSTQLKNPYTLTEEQITARSALKNDLQSATVERLQPRPPSPSMGPKDLKVEIVNWTDSEGEHSQAQITFYSQYKEVYQLQQSTDLLTWENLDDPIPGNNGPVLRSYDLTESRTFYRIQWETTS